MRLPWGLAIALVLTASGAMASSGIPSPPDYHVQEAIWIKENGAPASSWAHHDLKNPLNITDADTMLDVAYVLRSADPDVRPNISLVFYRNSDTRTRFLSNGTLLSEALEHGHGARTGNYTADAVEPFLVYNVSMTLGEYHLGYTYFLLLETIDLKYNAGTYQIRVNVSGLGGGSSWEHPNGNPNAPWTFFRLPSEAESSITPFLPEDARLRGSMRVNLTASGLPYSSYPFKGDYRIFIDGDNIWNGSYYGAGFFRNGSQLPRLLAPGTHNMTVSGGEVEFSTPFETHQWVTSLEVNPNHTIPGGQPVNITGSGFPVNESYSVFLGPYHIDGTPILSGAVSKYGNFSTQYAFPGHTALGEYVLTAASTQLSGPPISSTTVEIDPWAVNLTVQPTLFRQGGWLNVSGSEYPSDAWIEIYLDGEIIHQGRADENGTFFQRVYTLTDGLHPGEHVISANATEYGGPPCGRVLLTVEQFNTTLLASPNPTHPGRDLRIEGHGFPAYEIVVIELPGEVLGELVTDGDGDLIGEVTVPRDYPIGTHVLSVTAPRYGGPPGNTSILELDPWPAQVELQGVAPHPGGWVALSATGLPPETEYRVELDGATIRSGTTSSAGSAHVVVSLPGNLTEETHAVEMLVPGFTGPPRKAFPLDIVPWSPVIDLSPQQPRPGEALLLTGEGFPRNRNYDVFLDGSSIGSGSTSELGEILAYIFLRRNTTIGQHMLKLHVHSPHIANMTAALSCVGWKPGIEISPEFGCAGTRVEISAEGLPPSANLSLTWDGFPILNGSSTYTGSYHSEIGPPVLSDEAYHEIAIVCDQAYSGPPRIGGYFWWGCSPPDARIAPCDSTGSEESVFFLDEVPYVRGEGLPPGIHGGLHLLKGSDPLADSIHFAPILTDHLGGFLVPILKPGLSGNYTLWLDLNSNLLDDGNDILLESAFLVRPRPSISINSLEAGKTLAKQGEPILLSIELENSGGLEEVVIVSFFHGATEIMTLTRSVAAGGREPVEINWNTSSAPIGRRALRGEVNPLPGEIDENDNAVEGPHIKLEPPPSIAIRSLVPDRRVVKQGETIQLDVRVENMAPVQEIVTLEFLWDEDVVSTSSVNVAGSYAAIKRIGWNTSGYGPGDGRIRARTAPIPFEAWATDNDLASGSVTVLPPNSAPVADAGGPYVALVGSSIVLNASASRDDDGMIQSYLWVCGSETGVQAIWESTFAGAGSHQVGLTVTDDSGATDHVFATVDVIDPMDIQFWTSDAAGNERGDFLSSEPIHATLESPADIEVGLFIVPKGVLVDGFELGQGSEARYRSAVSGRRTLTLWSNSLPGDYVMVLDLDEDALFDPGFDRVYSPIHVVGQRVLLLALALLWLLAGKRREGIEVES